MSVRDTDKGYQATLKLLLKPAPGLRVGVFGPAADAVHEGTDKTVAEIALFHELGTPTISQRPFLTRWLEEHAAEVFKFVQDELNLKRGKKRQNWRQVLEKAGRMAVKGIRENMVNMSPPLAESTIKRKGHADTLVESGQLREAVTYQVDQRAYR